MLRSNSCRMSSSRSAIALSRARLSERKGDAVVLERLEQILAHFAGGTGAHRQRLDPRIERCVLVKIGLESRRLRFAGLGGGAGSRVGRDVGGQVDRPFEVFEADAQTVPAVEHVAGAGIAQRHLLQAPDQPGSVGQAVGAVLGERGGIIDRHRRPRRCGARGAGQNRSDRGHPEFHHVDLIPFRSCFAFLTHGARLNDARRFDPNQRLRLSSMSK